LRVEPKLPHDSACSGLITLEDPTWQGCTCDHFFQSSYLQAQGLGESTGMPKERMSGFTRASFCLKQNINMRGKGGNKYKLPCSFMEVSLMKKAGKYMLLIRSSINRVDQSKTFRVLCCFSWPSLAQLFQVSDRGYDSILR
jgi:hypothetical protein